MIEVGLKRLGHSAGLEPPRKASAGSAGLDLQAAVEAPVTVEPMQRVIVPTGWVMSIPRGFEGQIRPRSGRAWKQGLTVVNAPGTIDSDYRGEVGVLLVNLGDSPVRIERGDRVAQIVFSQVPDVAWVDFDGSSEATARGAGGFGSTGE